MKSKHFNVELSVHIHVLFESQPFWFARSFWLVPLCKSSFQESIRSPLGWVCCNLTTTELALSWWHLPRRHKRQLECRTAFLAPRPAVLAQHKCCWPRAQPGFLSPQATHFAEEVDGILLCMLHCQGFTILHEAARHGHNDLAQLLLQKAASVNATTHTRLCLNELKQKSWEWSSTMQVTSGLF